MIKTQKQKKEQLQMPQTGLKPRKSSITIHDIEALQELHLQKPKKSQSSNENSEQETPQRHEKQKKWQAAKEENQSMESDDSLSKHTLVDVNIFRQIDYLWLFNDELEFSERKDLVLEDAAIPANDMLAMH